MLTLRYNYNGTVPVYQAATIGPGPGDSFVEQVLYDGPLLFLDLDPAAGTQEDLSLFNNDGTSVDLASGAEIVAGYGSTIEFNGSSSRVTVSPTGRLANIDGAI